MRYVGWALALSVAAHGLVVAGVAHLPKESPKRKPTTITVAETKKPPKRETEKAKPPEPEPLKNEARPAALQKPAPPPPHNAPPPPANAGAVGNPNLAAVNLGDFGISMGNGPGIAVQTGDRNAGSGNAANTSPATKELRPQTAKPPSDGCSEATVKPKPLGAPVTPAPTEAAKQAGVEGKVRVSLRIDASGDVMSASVAGGLGYGLDDLAVAAAKRMKFNPATQCGKPVEGSFVVTFRFVGSD